MVAPVTALLLALAMWAKARMLLLLDAGPGMFDALLAHFRCGSLQTTDAGMPKIGSIRYSKSAVQRFVR